MPNSNEYAHRWTVCVGGNFGCTCLQIQMECAGKSDFALEMNNGTTLHVFSSLPCRPRRPNEAQSQGRNHGIHAPSQMMESSLVGAENRHAQKDVANAHVTAIATWETLPQKIVHLCVISRIKNHSMTRVGLLLPCLS